jgi:hypothetical protein
MTGGLTKFGPKLGRLLRELGAVFDDLVQDMESVGVALSEEVMSGHTVLANSVGSAFEHCERRFH